MPRSRLPHMPYDLVLLEWEDSRQPISAWKWVEDFTEPSVVQCISVGYKIAETELVVVIAPNLGDVNDERKQAGGVIQIPKCCITNTVKL